MKKYTFAEFVEIIAMLRGENGCPWDKEQTIESLKPCLIEECYEVIDAAKTGGMTLADELGDLLLQIVMISQIASETGEFDISDVISCVSEKMIRRHPHVFGDVQADTSEQVLENWDKIKQGEKNLKSVSDTLKDVPVSLPALLYAAKIQKKAAKVGFDFDSAMHALEKVKEEVSELENALSANSNIYEETGDLLFSAVNVSRLSGVNPELSLSDSARKFTDRFCKMEALATEKGLSLNDLSLSQMDELWDEIKKI